MFNSVSRQNQPSGRGSSVVFHAIALIILTGASSISIATQTGADENVAAALKTEAISAALEHVELHRDSTTAFLAHIAAIVSPSGQEHQRAKSVAARMRDIGLASVLVDETPNAIGIIPGSSGRSLVFISNLFT